jgi:methylenetetrahydrofolate dehydrogenase (NADP+) / methenyltetrahydrofolate cyclohydrolase
MIIDGKAIAENILQHIKTEIDSLKHTQREVPILAIVLVGNDPASEIYVRNKMLAAEKVGIKTQLLRFSSNISNTNLIAEISKLNNFDSVSGIIVQLPLPHHISKEDIIGAIDPDKDVDGFHPLNVGKLYSGLGQGLIPCTARGCLHLIKSTKQDLSGKNVVIIGRSNIVGRPLAALLLAEDCTVTIAHSKTINLQELTQKADIIISAIGSPRFLTNDYFNSEATVIDVGINRITRDGNISLVGDVDFPNVCDKVKFITPVPGGVGPMTVAYLLANCLDAFRRSMPPQT